MMFMPWRTLRHALACVLVVLAGAAGARDLPLESPVLALKRLYDADPAIRMGDYAVPPDGFKSFNQFFVRDLRRKKAPAAQ